MRKVLLFLMLAPLILFCREDTLYKKRINVVFGFDLSIPQRKSDKHVYDYRFPNEEYYSSKYSPLFISVIYQNAWNLNLTTDIKLYRKIYFQTGLNVMSCSSKSNNFGDSLVIYYHTLVNNATFTNKSYNFTMPMGLQYRFNKHFFATVGVMAISHSIIVQKETWYHNYSQVKPTTTNTYVDKDGPSFDFVKYLAVNVQLFPRTYFNLKLSTTTFKPDGFKENLYYSIGFTAFII